MNGDWGHLTGRIFNVSLNIRLFVYQNGEDAIMKIQKILFIMAVLAMSSSQIGAFLAPEKQEDQSEQISQWSLEQEAQAVDAYVANISLMQHVQLESSDVVRQAQAQTRERLLLGAVHERYRPFLPHMIKAFCEGNMFVYKAFLHHAEVLDNRRDKKKAFPFLATAVSFKLGKDVIEKLLENKASVNSSGGYRCSPLALAMNEKEFDICELLIQHKADIDGNRKEDTAATRGRNSLLLRALSNRNNSAWAACEKLIYRLISLGANVHNGNPLALVATHRNNKNLNELFLKHGAESAIPGNADFLNGVKKELEQEVEKIKLQKKPIILLAVDKDMLFHVKEMGVPTAVVAMIVEYAEYTFADFVKDNQRAAKEKYKTEILDPYEARERAGIQTSVSIAPTKKEEADIKPHSTDDMKRDDEGLAVEAGELPASVRALQEEVAKDDKERSLADELD